MTTAKWKILSAVPSWDIINKMTTRSPFEWRLILDPPQSGPLNMAMDEALLHHAGQKYSPPTLRLYAWDQPTLSLGYSQSSGDVEHEKLTRFGWGLVRRPTGGKAILHVDELTYSICGASDEGLFSGSLMESYQRISAVLKMALELLGVETSACASYNVPEMLHKNDPVCFKIPSNFEITWNQKKIIGSAQARKGGGVLQHGTLPLYGSLTRITNVLTYPCQAARESAMQNIRDHAATLQEAAKKVITWDQAAQAMKIAFTKTTGLELRNSEPNDNEIEKANELLNCKYSTKEWNFRI